MEFNGSIAAGTWTNWLGFELDPDHSPDSGNQIYTGFLNLSRISEEDMDEFRWNFMRR